MSEEDFKLKYLKYKAKYLKLKELIGSGITKESKKKSKATSPKSKRIIKKLSFDITSKNVLPYDIKYVEENKPKYSKQEIVNAILNSESLCKAYLISNRFKESLDLL